MAFADLKRLRTVTSFQHGVALLLENGTHERPNGLFVFYQQDRLRTLCLFRNRYTRFDLCEFLFDPGQVDLKRGASPWLTIDPNIAAALLDDSVDG